MTKPEPKPTMKPTMKRKTTNNGDDGDDSDPDENEDQNDNDKDVDDDDDDDDDNNNNNNNNEQHQRKAAVLLDTYWNMTRPKVDFSGIDEAGGEFDFNLESTISDAITNDMIQVEVWTKPCQNIGVEPIIRFTSASSQSSSDLLELSSTDAYETGDGDGTQTICVNG